MASTLGGNMEDGPASIFAGKVRCRVCGILQTPEGLLMIRHDGLGPAGYLWAPPGGGIDFGDSAEDSLEREFIEETGLRIKVGDFLFINEYRDHIHHSLELFFQVEYLSGVLRLGSDPELIGGKQMLSKISYLTDREINEIPMNGKHNIFRECPNPSDIVNLRGFFKFANN